MIFLCYPKCSTCRKAQKWLDDNQVEYNIRNIVTDNPTKAELNLWINSYGKDIKGFFNTSGLKYRELNLKDKLKTMSREEKLDLLSSDGMLVKRPVLIDESFVLIGFREEEWENAICIKQ